MRWRVPLPEATGDEAADLAAFLAWEEDRDRHYHPELFGPDGQRLPIPREFTYYLGVPEPSWLGHSDGVPKFVSAARFNRYVTDGDRWPVASASPYAIDSGAYIALTGRNKTVPWFDDPDVYGGKILRFIDNTGYPPDFAAIQDYPCEDAALAATGLTVRDHQDLTTDAYVWAVREFPMVPWIPVLQGKNPGDHVDHYHMYQDRGIDLAACHRVGVGSICRLTELDGLVERIAQLEDLAAQGLKLHGFGLKTDALPLVGHLLASADSMAWSAHVRHNGKRNPIRLPDCTHAGDCRNCYRYAVHWREQVLASMNAKEDTVPVVQPVAAPGNDKDYWQLLHDGVLIDLAGRPLTWGPCSDCKGEGTSGMTCPMALECRYCGAKPRRMCRRPSEHAAAELHKARYADAEADNKRRAAAGDLSVPAPWPTKESPVPAAATKIGPVQGDLLAGLIDLTALVADNAAKKTAAKAPRRTKKKPPAPVAPPSVVVPADRMVTATELAALGPGTMFYYGLNTEPPRIFVFEGVEEVHPGTGRIRTANGAAWSYPPDSRTLRLCVPQNEEYGRRLARLNPLAPMIALGTVKAAEVAAGTFVRCAGMLPDGETCTVTGYVIRAVEVGANYQGWVKDAGVIVLLSDRPDHLDGVPVAVTAAELSVVSPALLDGFPDGTPAPWLTPTLEEVLAAAGLRLVAEPAQPGDVTWPAGLGQDMPGEHTLRRLFLSEAGGVPAGYYRMVLQQEWLDKAIADRVWPGPIEPSGPTPLHRVRQGAPGAVRGLVDGVERSVVGTFERFWSGSHGIECEPVVNVVMHVPDGKPGGWRSVTVQVPWTGEVPFHAGADHLDDPEPAAEPAAEAEPELAEERAADLFDLLGLTSAIADAAEQQPPSGVIPLAEAQWGMYGEVSAAWGPDGGKAGRRRGYLVELPRIYTGGIAGHSAKTPKGAGRPLLLTEIEVRPDGGANSLYCPPDATFTIMDAPGDHALHATMRLSRRLPFADLRPGDVFYIWDERGGVRDLAHRGGWNVADLRTRFHVQTVPVKDGASSYAVDVLIDGEGETVTMRRAAGLWTDIADPREQPCNVAGQPVANPLVAARRNLADRLGQDYTVLVAPDGVVATTGEVYEDTVSEAFGSRYRWWMTLDNDLDLFRPCAGEQYGVIGGYVGVTSDGLDDGRTILAQATIEHDGLRLPRDLGHADWQLVHDVLRGMGATGGARKGQPYTVKDSWLPQLWAFIAGGPAPRHERATAGWVRTPDKLAADVVARFAEVDRLPARPRVLEPSAGDGSLISAVLAVAPKAELVAVEPDPERARGLFNWDPTGKWRFSVHNCTLEEYAANVAKTQSQWRADLTVMNPPYSVPGNRGLWAQHVELAWDLLAVGGRLVAILPGDLTRPDARRDRLLKLVGPDVQTGQLPKGSFKQRGKGGTDIDTWVLAATKQPRGEQALSVYADSLCRPAAGEPVRVAEVATNRKAAQEMPVQASRGWGGDFVARYVGRCIVCTVSCWGRDDGSNDPRGVLGLNAVHTLVAAEVGLAGPDVCLCWSCADSGIMRERGLARARTLWSDPGLAPLTFTGMCPDCGTCTEPAPAEGDGETWKSAEQWLYLAMQDHKTQCPGPAANADAEAEAYVAERMAALFV